MSRAWIGASIILLSTMFTASAQDRNAVVMQKLYSKIENTLGLSSLANPGAASGLLLATPGYVIDKTNIDYNTPDGEKLLQSLVDNAPLPNWIWRATGTYFSDVYDKIISFHESPIITLTDAEKTNLKKAQTLLFTDSSLRKKSQTYQDYERTRDTYYTAASTLQAWQAAHPHQTPPAPLTSAVTKARGEWNGKGHKAQIEAALSVYETLNNKDPAAFWGALRARFDDNQATLGTGRFAIYQYYPAYQTWIDDSQNWTGITLNDSELDTVKTSSHVSWGGGFSAGWGLWSAGGGYSETTDRTSLNIDSQKFNILFEVMRVRVNRPWMDASIFGAHTWDWTPGSVYDRRVVSDGQNDEHTAPSGVAPFLITELLLARKVSLTGNWTTSLSTTYHNAKSGGAHVGWGPFSFGGNYNLTYDEAHDNTKITDNTITSPDVQIIGALVQTLPKSPDADRQHYKWPDQAPLNIEGFVLSGEARRNFERRQSLDRELQQQLNLQ